MTRIAVMFTTLALAVPATASATPLTYTGNGVRLLAPVRFTHETTVHWRARGGLFMLIALTAPAAAGPNPQLIVSYGSSGVGSLPAGRYRFKIGALGAWRVTFSR